MKSTLFFLFSKYIVWRERVKMKQYQKVQNKVLQHLIKSTRSTQFAKDHDWSTISNFETLISKVPLRDYEAFRGYLEQIKMGQRDVLQSGVPLYMVVSSGTTSGAKYIPVSKESIRSQINAALKLLCFHAVSIGHGQFMNFKMLFLQGSPILSHEFPIPSARLSGVVYHHVPRFFNRNKLPSYQTNIEPHWQQKVELIAEECLQQNISVLGGIPPWCIQLFEELLNKSEAPNLKALFPALSTYIYGGVEFAPYESKIKKMLGEEVALLETYPASEGFFAISDAVDLHGMTLLVDQGVFYEFIPIDQSMDAFPKTLRLEEVKLNEKYEMVISTNAGLWRYRIGDIVEFTSLRPFKIKVVGRTSQFISAFGEHVIASEIDETLSKIIEEYSLDIEDAHVSPNVQTRCYEWRIEGEINPHQIKIIQARMDMILSSKNKYYKDLIDGNVLNNSKIIVLKTGTFHAYRTTYNKLGEQNKVQRLSNDSSLSNILDSFQ